MRLMLLICVLVVVGASDGWGQFDNMTVSQLQVYITTNADSLDLAKIALGRKLHEAGATRTQKAVQAHLDTAGVSAKVSYALSSGVYPVDSMYVSIRATNSVVWRLLLKSSDAMPFILKMADDTTAVCRRDRAINLINLAQKAATGKL